MSDTKKTAGQMILDHLNAKGKKARKAGTASTEELAEAIGQSVKYTFDRCYWMEKKTGVLVSSGAGKTRVWRKTPVVRKPKSSNDTAPESAQVEETTVEA